MSCGINYCLNMIFFNVVCSLISVVIVIEAFETEYTKTEVSETKTCKHLEEELREPTFDLNLVIGRWKIFYAWNFHQDMFEDRCLYISFKNATPSTINRIWNDMYEFLDTQPEWSAALMVMSIFPGHDMLLFAEDSVPGKFIGVANFVRSYDNLKLQNSKIPLFKIQLKVLKEGQWLVVSDCNIGITTLSARSDLIVNSSEEITSLAASLSIGNGFIACATDFLILNQLNSK